MSEILLKEAQTIRQQWQTGKLTSNEYFNKICKLGKKNSMSFWEIEKALTDSA